MAAKRNSSIDLFRLAAMGLVIMQHYRMFNMDTGAALWTGFYCRIAVPFFFMVSGYFSWRDDPEKRVASLKRQTATIGKILAGASVFLLAWDCVISATIRCTPERLFRLAVFNEPKFLFGHAHMWYMLALIYVFIVGLGVERFKLHRLAYIAAPLLFLGGVALDFYLFSHGSRYACYTRNFIFDGIPFFYLGQMIRRKEGALMRVVTKGRSLAVLLAAGVCMWLEASIMMRLGQDLSRTFYISIPLLSFGVFMVLLNFPTIGAGTFIVKYARDASLIIYVVHHAVEDVINQVALDVWGIKMFQHSTVRFILIFVISAAIGYAYAWLTAKMAQRASSRD